MTWIAEHRVIWILPSGERRPGRIAIGMPEPNASGDVLCEFALDGLPRSRSGPAFGAHALQALWHALQEIGMWLYLAFGEDGIRVLYPRDPDDEAEDPDSDTASLIRMLGPVIRAPLNPRGPADPDGKLAGLES